VDASADALVETSPSCILSQGAGPCSYIIASFSMPPRLPPGPSRLSQTLKHLQKQPRLALPNVAALKLQLAARNGHFGARYATHECLGRSFLRCCCRGRSHFLKHELPRIQYANPALTIEVNKVPRDIADTWAPELELTFGTHELSTLFWHRCTRVVPIPREVAEVALTHYLRPSQGDGKSHTIRLDEKWSTTIVRELMDLAGGTAWAEWKSHALETGIPVVPGEESAGRPLPKKLALPPPTLAPWELVRAKNLAEMKKSQAVSELAENADAGMTQEEPAASSRTEIEPQI
jgi:small subunit ribosomal protein S25